MVLTALSVGPRMETLIIFLASLYPLAAMSRLTSPEVGQEHSSQSSQAATSLIPPFEAILLFRASMVYILRCLCC